MSRRQRGVTPTPDYQVRQGRSAKLGQISSLEVTGTTLENNRLMVRIDRNGDIASIYDKDAKHELLSAPVMLELRDNLSPPWPAWEVLYDTVRGPAREYVSKPTIRIIERGPVRVALEITRRASGSTFVQRVRVSEGGDRVDVDNVVDWKSPNSLLKASFPLAAANSKATYDLGVGTIDRTNNEPDKYEVPAQKWADITDASGRFGVGIINDSKHGWDKPGDNTLRLTLIHTPRPVGELHLSEQQRSRTASVPVLDRRTPGRLATGTDAASRDPGESAADRVPGGRASRAARPLVLDDWHRRSVRSGRRRRPEESRGQRRARRPPPGALRASRRARTYGCRRASPRFAKSTRPKRKSDRSRSHRRRGEAISRRSRVRCWRTSS